MDRTDLYEPLAAVLNEWFPDAGWTAEAVAEADERSPSREEDPWDPSVHFLEFALQVLERAEAIEQPP